MNLAHSSRYVFRMDDIHPRMNWERFLRAEALFDTYNVRPIIAVIPDNQDPELNHDEPCSDFWQYMKRLQDKGWTLAMHGYQHTYETKGSGIIGLNSYSEFVGLPYDQQLEKIKQGKQVLLQQGIVTDIFIAPAHAFDKNTCRALREHGFTTVSDGVSLWPFRRYGLVWIPQIMWRPHMFPVGDITVCLHTDSTTDETFERIESFLAVHASRVTDIPTVRSDYQFQTVWRFVRHVITTPILWFIFYSRFQAYRFFIAIRNMFQNKTSRYQDSHHTYVDPQSYESRWMNNPAEAYSHEQWSSFLEVRIKDSSKGVVVADLGSGTGRWVSASFHASHIYAVDISSSMIDYAKKRLQDKTNVTFLCESSLHTSIPGGSVDTVIMVGLLDYVDPDQQFTEVSRICSDSARILVLVPNASNFLHIATRLKHFICRQPMKRFYTKRSLMRHAQKAGFELVSFESKGVLCFVPRFMNRYARQIFLLLEYIFRPFQSWMPTGSNMYFEFKRKSL